MKQIIFLNSFDKNDGVKWYAVCNAKKGPTQYACITNKLYRTIQIQNAQGGGLSSFIDWAFIKGVLMYVCMFVFK